MRYELRPPPNSWYDNSKDLYRIDDNGEETLMGSDQGEPEDNSFYRDWKWVPEELNRLADIINTLNHRIDVLEYGEEDK